MPDRTRILIVTPEVSYLPEEMGSWAGYSAKAGELADVSAALISALFDLNCDVHVAIPDYSFIYHDYSSEKHDQKVKRIRQSLNEERIHFAADRAFLYKEKVYSESSKANLKVSLAFQREVINKIIPRVKPDIIHCNDWMTGLIPAMARQYEIPCLFSIHNIHTMTSTLAEIEDRGIDAASFWQWLYFSGLPAWTRSKKDAGCWPRSCTRPYLATGRPGFRLSPWQTENIISTLTILPGSTI